MQKPDNIFITTSNYSVGATFVDWSIYYLSGFDSFFNFKKNKKIPLSDNPILVDHDGTINAHKHNKNHPRGVNETLEYINKFLSLDSDFLYSAYPVPSHMSVNLEKFNIDLSELRNEDVSDKLLKYQSKELLDIMIACSQYDVPITYIHMDKSMIGYRWNNRSLGKFFIKDEYVSSTIEKNEEFFQTYFGEDSTMTTWDLREFRALNIRPYAAKFEHYKLDFSHRWINAADLWTLTDDVECDIMEYIGLNVNKRRFVDWLPVANVWQKHQNNNLKFYRNLDHILEYTVAGLSYDISDLTFDQEVIVQHMLIYKYNLNIKSWNLVKFPNNTKDLHSLLEENFHPVDKLYAETR